MKTTKSRKYNFQRKTHHTISKYKSMDKSVMTRI